MAKFKVGDKVRVRRDLNIGECYSGVVFVKGMNKYKGEIIEIEDIADDDIVFLKDINFAWLDEMLEEVKEDKMEKTFREVIADIKEGETWESKDKIVRCLFDGIQIYHKDKKRSTPSMLMLDDYKFTLQRKEYTFEEVFKAYEEGKVIESKESNHKYKKVGDRDLVEDDGYWDDFDIFEVYEIRGKWYIND